MARLRNRFPPALGRILAVALVGLLMLTAPVAAADPAPTGTVSVYLFHDRNNNSVYDSSDNIALSGSVTLGLSSDSGQSLVTAVTSLNATFNQNMVSVPVPAGTWRIKSISVNVPGYVQTSSFSMQQPQTQSATVYTYAQNPQITAVTGANTSVFIPVLQQTPGASVSGKVFYADSSATGVSGAVVTLICQNTGLQIPDRSYTVGSDGAYSFTGVTPASYKVQVAAPSSGTLQLSPSTQTGSAITVLDGLASSGNNFSINRTAWVRFRLRGSQIYEYESVTCGTYVKEPSFTSSQLTSGRTRYVIQAWYTDEKYSNRWDFSKKAVTENITLYAKYTTKTTSSGGSSSGGSSSNRGNNTQDVKKPEIKNVQATRNGSTINLSVTMAGGLPIFEYQWQMKNSNGVWENISGARSEKCALTGMTAGTTYTFRVVVTRETDGVSNTSIAVSATVPKSESPAMPTDNSQRPPAPAQNSGGPSSGYPSASTPAPALPSLTLSLSSEDFIFEGGRLVVKASEAGGVWEWDEGVLDSEVDNEKATFTGLKSGIANVSYTLDGRTVSAQIEIRPAVLPAVGQSIAPAAYLASIGIMLLALALLLLMRRKEVRYVSGA